MAAQNLTGIQTIFGGTNPVDSTLSQLSEEEQLQRKKKLMAAGQSSDFQSAMSTMFGNRLNSAGTPRA
jgi:hypothetical protein